MGGNKDSTSSIILHSNWASSCVYRVRICLSLKDLPYEVKPINFGDLLKPGADDELNPMRFVPVLEIDGHKLIESMAILNYVEETRPQPPLLPQDPFKRAQVRAICDIIVSGIQPLQNTAPLKFVNEYTNGEKTDEWIQYFFLKGFQAIEKLLVISAGQYCVGDQITFADCCLVPMVLNARRLEVDLSPFPNIVRIDGSLQNHPAFIRAHPLKQPDVPEEMLKDSVFYHKLNTLVNWLK